MSIYNRYTIHGFTLIELLITVVIIGVLMLIAVPSYQESIRISRRSEAHSGLIKMQLEQENYRMLNETYANAFGTASNDVKDRPGQYYSFSMSNVGGATYKITAQAPKGSMQYKDVSCRNITLDQSGNKLPAICW